MAKVEKVNITDTYFVLPSLIWSHHHPNTDGKNFAMPFVNSNPAALSNNPPIARVQKCLNIYARFQQSHLKLPTIK